MWYIYSAYATSSWPAALTLCASLPVMMTFQAVILIWEQTELIRTMTDMWIASRCTLRDPKFQGPGIPLDHLTKGSVHMQHTTIKKIFSTLHRPTAASQPLHKINVPALYFAWPKFKCFPSHSFAFPNRNLPLSPMSQRQKTSAEDSGKCLHQEAEEVPLTAPQLVCNECVCVCEHARVYSRVHKG